MSKYCAKCDSVILGDVEHDCLIPKQASVYEKEIWNAAIEAAASVVDQANRDGPYQAIASAKEILKLKK